jgi:hypothetical protein
MASPTKTSQQCGSRTTSRKRITYGGGVSENAVFLFRYGLLLERRGERDTDRFKEVERELSREFGLRPWEPSIFDVTAGIDDDEEILASVKPDHREYYRRVINLRRALVGAPHPR